MEVFLKFVSNFFRCFKHIWLMMVVLLIFVLLGALAIAKVEGIDVGSSIYFALITALTIGYGDITPTTVIGKILSVLIGVVGVMVLGLVVAVITRALMLSMHPEDGR